MNIIGAELADVETLAGLAVGGSAKAEMGAMLLDGHRSNCTSC